MAFWDEQQDSELSPQEIAQYTRTQLQAASSDILEEVEEKVVRKERSSISPALLRLEQGKLYQMLIEHDLFSDIDAHPQAVENVQRELKDFITSRLEIMLGLRTDKEPMVARNDSVFSPTEIEALKALAKKLTDSVSKKPEEVKSGNLTPVGVDKAKSMIAKMQPKPIQQKAPVKAEKKVEIPKKVKKGEVTLEDLIERNKQIKIQKAEPESAIKLPMPNADIMTRHYESQLLSDPNKMALIQRVLKS